MKALILGIASIAQAVVIPTTFSQERSMMGANLKSVDPSDPRMAYSLILNRPATSRKATSFTFFEGRTDVRCTGRCLPIPQNFKVIEFEEDACGNVVYHAVRKEHVVQTDDEPDMLGHLAPELVVADHSQSDCTGERRDWEVEYIHEGVNRRFEGMPEPILTIQ